MRDTDGWCVNVSKQFWVPCVCLHADFKRRGRVAAPVEEVVAPVEVAPAPEAPTVVEETPVSEGEVPALEEEKAPAAE